MRTFLILFLSLLLLAQVSFCQSIDDCDYPVYRKGYFPEFKGGNEKLEKFIQSRLKYPKVADEQGIHGSVRVKFRVGNNAKIDSVQIERGLGYGFDEEAIRVVKLTSGKWKPGTTNGKKEAHFLIYDVKFELP